MREPSRELKRQAIPAPLDQRRLSERRRCHLHVRLITRHGTMQARLLDLSTGGFGFTLDIPLVLRPGDVLVLSHADLGEVPATLRWSAHPRYGASFVPGARALTGLRAFYDRLGPIAGETA